MKYVWASWDTVSRRTVGEKIKGFRDKHIRGYGRAVSFSSTEDVIWSPPQPTYLVDEIHFETTISRD